ncbi:MAG TPA: hypothetical protein VFM29_02750 [Vicinamibacteria bacterium]|nr:hypothetical protein [Vicinamibacteria bacterium]
MSRANPQPSCFELALRGRYPIDEMGEVALEDYARALLRATGAEAVRATRDPSLVRAVHVCAPGLSPGPAILTDLEDFAKSLVVGVGGLGWS